MQLFQIRKFLPQISRKISRKQTKPWAETSDAPQAAGDKVTDQIQENEGNIPTEEQSSANMSIKIDTSEEKSEGLSSISPTEGVVAESTEIIAENATDAKVSDEDRSTQMADKSNAIRSENGLAHLTSGVPRGASIPRGMMTASELRAARELFGNMDEREIMRLYKKVTQ